MTVTLFNKEAVLLTDGTPTKSQEPTGPDRQITRVDLLHYMRDLTTELRHLAAAANCGALARLYAQAIDESGRQLTGTESKEASLAGQEPS